MMRFPFMMCLILFLRMISTTPILSEETFVLINGNSGQKIVEMGSHIDERITPCSTFKIALSLMGFDAGILKDENEPKWQFQEGYDDYLDSWKQPQTPQSWMKFSCVWYSRVLATKLGIEKFQFYLDALDYGDRDASGGLTKAWLTSSLKVSPVEQIAFLQKMLKNELPVSTYAIEKTKQLLFLEELPMGWKLFGKTGTSISKPDGKNELGWFVGWVVKGEHYYIFAFNIRDEKVVFSERIPRVKQLLEESSVMFERLPLQQLSQQH